MATKANRPDNTTPLSTSALSEVHHGLFDLEEPLLRLRGFTYAVQMLASADEMPTEAGFALNSITDMMIEDIELLIAERSRCFGFVDMSGGSSDDATLSIAHIEHGKTIVDLVVSQAGAPPFNSRQAVVKFANQLREYGLRMVTGDNYAGLAFKQDFESFGTGYTPCRLPKTALYEELEPKFNAGEIELPDIAKLQEQALGLVVRGARVDHLPGEHDDWINAAAGAAWCASSRAQIPVAQSGRYSWG